MATPIRLQIESDRLADYLVSDEVIDWRHPSIQQVAAHVAGDANDELECGRRLFEWVRDEVAHSSDAQHSEVTCSASHVLRSRTGICFAKSHLLAALARAGGIPAGFCYQRLRRDDDSEAFTLHGLNALYFESLDRWMRFDPRGNREALTLNLTLTVSDWLSRWMSAPASLTEPMKVVGLGCGVGSGDG